MNKPYSTTNKAFLAIIAAIGWFALLMQFYLIIIHRTASVAETIIRYFSFFTLLTNIVVAACCSVLLSKPNSVSGRFFAGNDTLTAITVYIVIVGIVYHVILRSVWKPQNLQLVADQILHTAVPCLFFGYWVLFVNKTQLSWNVFPWLLYPFIYGVFVLLRGTMSAFYPYPFIDAGKLGLNKTLVNIAALTMAFLIVSLLFVAIGKLIARKSVTDQETIISGAD